MIRLNRYHPSFEITQDDLQRFFKALAAQDAAIDAEYALILSASSLGDPADTDIGGLSLVTAGGHTASSASGFPDSISET